MKTSEQINEIATALSKAQAKMQLAERDSNNPFFSSTYADLASVWEACRGPLTENGLSVVQCPVAEGNKVTVDTMLMHSSGQWVQSSLTATAKKDDAQAIGSAITYLRRYSLQSLVGVAPADDDGNAATGKSNDNADAAPQRKPAPVELTEEESAYVRDAQMEIVAAESEDALRSIGEFIKKKSPAVQNALRKLFLTRLEVLKGNSTAA